MQGSVKDSITPSLKSIDAIERYVYWSTYIHKGWRRMRDYTMRSKVEKEEVTTRDRIYVLCYMLQLHKIE
jgi:hypothetical protein